MTIAVWLGSAPPVRSVRWLDGALLAAAKLAKEEPRGGQAIAIAAGEPTWLDLAADRATRAGLASAGVPSALTLDYLGWAQVAAAALRHVDATTILVDEASRPERYAEVAAIAELLEIAQLTRVVSLSADGTLIHASRATAHALQTIRVRGPVVIGVRIAGPAIEEYPTPTPSASMKRLDLVALGLDPVVLDHRSLPPIAAREPRRTVDRVADHLAVHVVAPPAAARGDD